MLFLLRFDVQKNSFNVAHFREVKSVLHWNFNILNKNSQQCWVSKPKKQVNDFFIHRIIITVVSI